jgi:hypothetical protein
MADKNIQMTQRNSTNTGWDNLYPITKASNVQVAPISGLAGTDVQTVLQNLFQFANDGKTQIANAITAKGVSASPTETFTSLAEKIGQIITITGKRWAVGYNASADGNNNLTITGIGFKPSIIIVKPTTADDTNYGNGRYISVYVDKSVFNLVNNINFYIGNSGNAFAGSVSVNANGFTIYVATRYNNNWIAIE